MTDETPLLLVPRDKFVTLNLFDRKFCVLHNKRGCVDLVPPDGFVFFTDGSLCWGRAGAGVFSDILKIRELYALGSYTTVF
jgi:hypothetical protein